MEKAILRKSTDPPRTPSPTSGDEKLEVAEIVLKDFSWHENLIDPDLAGESVKLISITEFNSYYDMTFYIGDGCSGTVRSQTKNSFNQ
jgi:hypothetical protein